MKYLLFSFAIICLATTVQAQTTPSDFVEKFFTTFENDGSDKALDDLYATNDWIKQRPETLTQLKKSMNDLTEDYVGKYYGYDLICKKNLLDRLVLMSYMVRYGRQPIRFTFEFYQPDQEWMLYSFKFDIALDDEMEESAGMQYQDLSDYSKKEEKK